MRSNVLAYVRRITPASLLAACLMTSFAVAQPATAPKQPAKGPAASTPAAQTPKSSPVASDEQATRRFGSPAKPRTPGTFRLATYNVENLFDDKDDPNLSGDHEDKDATKPTDHCKAAADAIQKIDADVIALEEVESYDAVIQFRDRYLKDAGYTYVASIDAGDERGIEQAVLSRFPLKDAKVWLHAPLGGTHPDKWGKRPNENAGKPIQFHRSPMCVTVEVPMSGGGKAGEAGAKKDAAAEPAGTYKLTLFVVHQKSGSDGNYWREKEAHKIVELSSELTKADPERNIVILGDFNATMSQPPMKTYIAGGFTSAFYPRVPGEETGRATDEAADADNADSAKKPGDGKTNDGATPRRNRGPDPRRVTHESGRVIDHILFNPAALKELRAESRFVFAMPARPEGADWRVTPPPSGYASDHYPVVVDVVIGDK